MGSPALIFFTVGTAILPRPGLAEEKASCQRETVSDGYFVTTVTDTVELARREAMDVRLNPHADKSKHEIDVFAFDEGGHPESRPLTHWLSTSKLQIIIPNKSLIGLQKSNYEGVDMLVKFEPDDSSERAQWLKALGLPTK